MKEDNTINTSVMVARKACIYIVYCDISQLG